MRFFIGVGCKIYYRQKSKKLFTISNKSKKCVSLSSQNGKVQEWLNWPAWKASKRQKRFRGSNPLLSATLSLQQTDFQSVVFYCNRFVNKFPPNTIKNSATHCCSDIAMWAFSQRWVSSGFTLTDDAPIYILSRHSNPLLSANT